MNLNFNKSGNGLIPAIIQESNTQQVLMLGFMNLEAYEQTKREGIVTFFSRTKNRLWTKGGSSGNFLKVKHIQEDCDRDTLLIQVEAAGPACHTGAVSCFGADCAKGFLYELEQVISQRIHNNSDGSYTNKLYRQGINRVAQKVGEEAVELVIEAKDNNAERFKNEAADLLYHLLILLRSKDTSLLDIESVLRSRVKTSR